MNRSAVIIGGGLGGLFTGAILAHEGLDVTVLEKNRIIGGGLQSFRRFGETFDTGMHIIGGMQKDGNIRRICEWLGIADKVHVKDSDPANIDSIFYAEDGRTYHIAQGRTGFVESLCRDFPDQRACLEAYVDALYRVAGEVDLFYLRPSPEYMQVHSEDFQMSASGFIAKYIGDEHLRSVVAYLNPLYGGREDTTPAYMHALISVLYIDGSSRFAGGSVLFAETLAGVIAAAGGRVLSDDAVASVHSEGKMITGVTTASGRTFTADCYISAIHPCTLFGLLDDPAILPKPYRARLGELPNSYSAFTLNIKLKPGRVRFFNYTMYYMSRYDAIWSFGRTLQWPCGFLYVTPPEIEQGEYARKVIVTAPMQWRQVLQWENTTVGQRGAEYERWKLECAEKLLDCMEEIIPGFRDCIETYNSASPLTIRDFYGVKQGSMYGFSKDCANLVLSQVPVVTKVPNLYLTGQNCNLHGFCGVTLTAINTAEAILGRNYVLDRIDRFGDIRPLYEYEIYDAMQRLAASPRADVLALPGEAPEVLRARMRRIVSTAEFQRKVALPALRELVRRTCGEVECGGFSAPDRHVLYVCEGPDALFDAALLALTLADAGLDTPEIGLDPGLLQDGFALDLAGADKVFRLCDDPDHLRDYIGTTILQRGQSVAVPASCAAVVGAGFPALRVRVSCDCAGDGLYVLRNKRNVKIEFYDE